MNPGEAKAYETVIRPSRPLAVFLMVVSAAALLLLGLAGPVALVQFGGLMALLGVIGYVAYWRPSVRVDREGLHVFNPLRRVRLPWGRIDLLEARYGLRVHVGDATFDAWAVPAPRGMGRARGRISAPAQAILDRAERERELGLTTSSGDAIAPRWVPENGVRIALAATLAWIVIGPFLAAAR